MDNPELFEKCRQEGVNGRLDSSISIVLDLFRWGNNDKVLDYGSGPGAVGYKFLIPLITKHNATLTSVDCSEQMIEYARKTYPHPQITYECANIMDPPTWSVLKDVKFDKIFAHLVLHFVKDTQEILHRFHANLAPRGTLAFTFLSKTYGWNCHQFFGRHERWGKYMTDYEEFLPTIVDKGLDPKEEFGKQLINAGFSIVAMDTRTIPFPESVNNIVNLYWSIYPFTTRVPAEEQVAFREDIAMFLQQTFRMDQETQILMENVELFHAVVEKIN